MSASHTQQSILPKASSSNAASWVCVTITHHTVSWCPPSGICVKWKIQSSYNQDLLIKHYCNTQHWMRLWLYSKSKPSTRLQFLNYIQINTKMHTVFYIVINIFLYLVMKHSCSKSPYTGKYKVNFIPFFRTIWNGNRLMLYCSKM